LLARPLVTTARNRAIDRIRRDRTLPAKARLLDVPETKEVNMDETVASTTPAPPMSAHSNSSTRTPSGGSSSNG
jgi:DNA-directed RNA polymerase specialized sigma24 family protein